jgi:hypothetical protein
MTPCLVAPAAARSVGMAVPRSGYSHGMTDPRLEDHAIGVELQIGELVERLERAEVQGQLDQVASLQVEIERLQDDLARTADTIAGEHWEKPEIHLPSSA